MLAFERVPSCSFRREKIEARCDACQLIIRLEEGPTLVHAGNQCLAGTVQLPLLADAFLAAVIFQ